MRPKALVIFFLWLACCSVHADASSDDANKTMENLVVLWHGDAMDNNIFKACSAFKDDSKVGTKKEKEFLKLCVLSSETDRVFNDTIREIRAGKISPEQAPVLLSRERLSGLAQAQVEAQFKGTSMSNE